MNDNNQEIYMMNEVTMPVEYGVATAESVCSKCGHTKKECTCKK